MTPSPRPGSPPLRWLMSSITAGQCCAMGVTTQLNGYPGDHALTQVLAQTDVVSWLGARFAGGPAPSNC